MPQRDPALSQLHRLERRVAQALEEDPEQFSVETIQPMFVPPWWDPPEITIADTREEAIQQHNSLPRDATRVCTDGSSY
ncbi:uncharacterized protein ATNIH1004_010466 [Aspergillus tanneri]|uniref:Uncharacterized protein n=1 Tax=Aspergillus tanneri TaxID=1220188 RepID=A0A5M9M9G2_9EURO|nr:uncharacterized protein ATNIH1004_010466 [Aspergillus tanneri]KAA8643692.1 hypothetical protein ATNIH1004_010466 [Aspergillus tanneri]